ncbi:BTAD domain-containing putative transcriptional regulator [Streptomyces sp. NPDC056194]|uniref:AfsR/SARP family transcriptional regulator n=1 Tax=unclassified Streptomyces TaxID=2593676 RepID=UPI0035DB9C40
MEPYLSAAALWSCRHAACGGVVRVKASSVRSGYDPCPVCRAVGYKQRAAVRRTDPNEPMPTVLFGEEELLLDWDEDWVGSERERLRQLCLHALDKLAYRLAREGRHALALETALTSVRGEPLREGTHRAVVAVHLVEGNVNEAVRHCRAFRRLLREKLGVPPSTRFPRMLPPGRWRPSAGPSIAQRTDDEVMTLG